MLIILTSNEVFNIYDKLDIDKKEGKEKACENKSQENRGETHFLIHKTVNKFQDAKKNK